MQVLKLDDSKNVSKLASSKRFRSNKICPNVEVPFDAPSKQLLDDP